MARRWLLTLMVVVLGFGIGMFGTAAFLGVSIPVNDPGSINVTIPDVHLPTSGGNETVVSPTPTGETTATPKTTTATAGKTTPAATTTATTPEEQSGKCTKCHPDAASEPPHKRLGNSCRTCHPKSVHVIHNKAVECEHCHGSGAGLGVPQPPKPGKPVCTACHADNVVTVHVKNHGRKCSICHGSDMDQIHKRPVGN